MLSFKKYIFFKFILEYETWFFIRQIQNFRLQKSFLWVNDKFLVRRSADFGSGRKSKNGRHTVTATFGHQSNAVDGQTSRKVLHGRNFRHCRHIRFNVFRIWPDLARNRRFREVFNFPTLFQFHTQNMISSSRLFINFLIAWRKCPNFGLYESLCTSKIFQDQNWTLK